MSLMDKLRKNTKLKFTDTLADTEILNNADTIPTMVPALNIAFSGSLDGGVTPGLTMICGESKTFKSLLSLICAKAYLDKYPDAVLMFYDSEMGASKGYFDSVGIPQDRVLYVPITNVEELKFDLVGQLEGIDRGDHVIIVVDSVGNLASKKELDDTLEEKSAADMTRAKQFKSLTRMITPYLNLKNIPMIVINHVYMTMELFARPVAGGGTGWVYSSNQIFYISRSQEKKGADIVGWNFNINIMKSRTVREKAKIPLTVMNDSGVQLTSGLLEMGLAAGVIHKPSNGWYQIVDEDGVIGERKYRASELMDYTLWKPILARKEFKQWVEQTFKVSSNKLVRNIDDIVTPDAEFTSADVPAV